MENNSQSFYKNQLDEKVAKVKRYHIRATKQMGSINLLCDVFQGKKNKVVTIANNAWAIKNEIEHSSEIIEIEFSRIVCLMDKLGLTPSEFEGYEVVKKCLIEIDAIRTLVNNRLECINLF